jgi:acetyl esterase/lipase
MVMYYGLLDLVMLRDGIPPSVPDSVLRAFSPNEFVARGPGSIPPLFIAQAGRDDPLLNATITSFVATAQANGRDIEYVIQAEGQHGFDRLMTSHRVPLFARPWRSSNAIWLQRRASPLLAMPQRHLRQFLRSDSERR